MSADSNHYQQIDSFLSLPAALSQWLLAKSVAGATRQTLAYYHAEVERFISFADSLGLASIDQVSPVCLRSFLDQLSATRNPGGVHAAWRPIRAMFLWYESEFEPPAWRNPVRKVHLPSPRPSALPGLSMPDFLTLLESCSQRDRAMFLCLLDSCCRALEFINLDVGDVNLNLGDVLVRAGKGGLPRYVSLGSRARKELRRYLKSRPSLAPSAPLFITRAGQRFSYDGLVSLLRFRAAQAGIVRPGLHDFRRAGALELLRNGADVTEISKYLGHRSLEVTVRYLAITPDDLRLMHRRHSPVDNLMS